MTVVAYVMYTLESPTAQAVGEETLSYSTVFVLYGVPRYVFLVGGARAALLPRRYSPIARCWPPSLRGGPTVPGPFTDRSDRSVLLTENGSKMRRPTTG